MRIRSALPCVIASLVLVVSSVDGASFDCSRPNRPEEKLICKNPELSALDEILDAAYKKAHMGLSREAQNTLVKGQREWIKFWVTTCSVNRKCAELDTKDASCASHEYKERIEVLIKKRFSFKGGFEIYPVDRYIEIQTKHGDKAKTSVFHFTDYQQLDTAGLTGQKLIFANKLNEWILTKVDKQFADFNNSDVTHEVALTPLSANIVGLNAIFSYYALGTPHGDFYERTYFFDTSRMAQIHSGDIFKNSGWILTSSRYIMGVLQKQLGKNLFTTNQKDFDEVVKETNSWWLPYKGLRVQFPYNTITGRPCGLPRAVVPWKILEPFFTDFMKAEIKTLGDRSDQTWTAGCYPYAKSSVP